MQRSKAQIEQGHIWTFPGGIHPPQRKTLSNASAIARPPLPPQLVLLVRQHIGQAGDIQVQVGDQVLKGQPLTASGASRGLPLHAPTSGLVTAIEERPSAHPSALPELAIMITPDGEERWVERQPLRNYQQLDAASLIDLIQQAGIAGLGGAGFPTAQKLAPQKPLDYLIINGVECEPYITADDRLMREYAADIVAGIEILQHITHIERVLIGIEDNKPEAIMAMREACQNKPQLSVREVPTKYPSGGEKQLIQLLTGRQVPSRGLPIDIGLLVQNVGTAFAVKRAIIDGEPLLERVVTLTGEALQRPGNVWALLGTPVKHLLHYAEYQPQPNGKIIMGGPMMGFTLPTDAVPIVKISNCVLAPTTQELPDSGAEMPCIRCGACADVCPASLLPQQLQWLAKAKDYDALDEHNLFDCIECGACAYVCPSDIPLVHYYRQAKAEIRQVAREKAKAEIARERFEARQARLEREKEERLARHRKASAARQAAQADTGNDGDNAKANTGEPSAAVKAALARAKAKKQAQQAGAENEVDVKTDSDEKQTATTKTDDKSAAVAAAIARAKAKKAKPDGSPDNSEMAKLREQRKAEARQRKAEREQQAEQQQAAKTTTLDEAPQQASDDKRQAAVQAAIARAKAKKQAAQAQADVAKNDAASNPANSDESADSNPVSTDKPATDDDRKQAAIKAAIARAKAKKQAAQSSTTQQPQDDNDS